MLQTFYRSLRNISARELFFYIAYICVSLLFSVVYFDMTREYFRSTLQAMTDFSADTPFQYRLLVPMLVHVIRSVFPISIFWLFRAFTSGAVLLLIFAFRRYLYLFLNDRDVDVYAFVIFYPLLWNYCVLNPFYHPADIPAILFFTLGLIYIAQRQWLLYYVIFVIASINRETSCFLTFALCFALVGKQRSSWLVGHVVLQLAIWLTIRITMSYAFAANAGEKVFENHIRSNLEFLFNYSQYGRLQVGRIFTFGFIWMLIPVYWNRQPDFFKRALLTTIPFMIGMGIVGNLYEVRIYSELVPIIVGPAIYSIHTLMTGGVSAETGAIPKS
jgi:hypothetical protein